MEEKGSVDQCNIFNLVNNFDLTKNMQQYHLRGKSSFEDNDIKII